MASAKQEFEMKEKRNLLSRALTHHTPDVISRRVLGVHNHERRLRNMKERNFWSAAMCALLLFLIPNIVFGQTAPLAQEATPAATRASVKVMTWNIEGGGQCKRNRDMHKVGNVIRRYDPDVIVLQEIHRKQVLDLVYDLASMHTYVSWFAETKSCGDGEDDDDFGLAILSIYPIGNQRAFRLRNHPIEEEREEFRTLMRVAIRVDDEHLVRVYNTHLTSQDDKQGDKYRKWQVQDILDIVAADEARAERTNRVFQPVLMGDFNFKPTAEPYKLLKPRFKDTWAIWSRHHTDFDNPNGFTSPTRKPDKRIDYVFAGRHSRISNREVRVPDVTTILADFDTQNREAVPDHLPVIANLFFR
jgi:endonuclease/exonuclease/phosphatase family metal-dependent hydrolase